MGRTRHRGEHKEGQADRQVGTEVDRKTGRQTDTQQTFFPFNIVMKLKL